MESNWNQKKHLQHSSRKTPMLPSIPTRNWSEPQKDEGLPRDGTKKYYQGCPMPCKWPHLEDLNLIWPRKSYLSSSISLAWMVSNETLKLENPLKFSNLTFIWRDTSHRPWSHKKCGKHYLGPRRRNPTSIYYVILALVRAKKIYTQIQ